jgi:hypothetical protein
MKGDCLNCGHPIGYHHDWVSSDEEMFCTCLDCDCPGFRDEMISSPQTGPRTRSEPQRTK